MDPIPQPHLLDPDRLLDPQRDEFTADHESRAQMYADGLRESCAYAQQLWHTADAVRSYLMDSLPPDPRAPGEHVTCAAPTGPDDERGWTRWIDMFSSVTSVMCGPHGDSGYGFEVAKRAALLRRDVPTEPRRDKVVAEVPAPQADAEALEVDAAPVGPPVTATRPDQPRLPKPARVAVIAVVVALAVRGTLPRRRA